jgi:hypothetical protein
MVALVMGGPRAISGGECIRREPQKRVPQPLYLSLPLYRPPEVGEGGVLSGGVSHVQVDVRTIGYLMGTLNGSDTASPPRVVGPSQRIDALRFGIGSGGHAGAPAAATSSARRALASRRLGSLAYQAAQVGF